MGPDHRVLLVIILVSEPEGFVTTVPSYKLRVCLTIYHPLIPQVFSSSSKNQALSRAPGIEQKLRFRLWLE